MVISLDESQLNRIERAVEQDFDTNLSLRSLRALEAFFRDKDDAIRRGTPLPDEENFFAALQRTMEARDYLLADSVDDNQAIAIEEAFYQTVKSKVIEVMKSGNGVQDQVEALGTTQTTLETTATGQITAISSQISAWEANMPHHVPHIRGSDSLTQDITNIVDDFEHQDIASLEARVRACLGHLSTIARFTTANKYTKVPFPGPAGAPPAVQTAHADAETAKETQVAALAQTIGDRVGELENTLNTFLHDLQSNGLNGGMTLERLQARARIFQRIEDEYPLLGVDSVDDQEESFNNMIIEHRPDAYGLNNTFNLPRRALAVAGGEPYAAAHALSDADAYKYYGWAAERKGGNDFSAEQREALDDNAAQVFRDFIDMDEIKRTIGTTDYMAAHEAALPAVEIYMSGARWNGQTRPGSPTNEENYFIPLLAWHLGISDNLTEAQRLQRVQTRIAREVLSTLPTVPLEDAQYAEDVKNTQNTFSQKIRQVFKTRTTAENAEADYLNATQKSIHHDILNEFEDADLGSDEAQRNAFILKMTSRIMDSRMGLLSNYNEKKSQGVLAKFSRKVASNPVRILLGSSLFGSAAVGASLLFPITATVAAAGAVASGGIFAGTFTKYLSNKLGIHRGRKDGDVAIGESANGLSVDQANRALTRQVMLADEIEAEMSVADGQLSLSTETKAYQNQLKTATDLNKRSAHLVQAEIRTRVTEAVESGLYDTNRITVHVLRNMYNGLGSEANFSGNLRGAKNRALGTNIGASLAGALSTGFGLKSIF